MDFPIYSWPGPWQRNFVNTSFLQFHMFPDRLDCTTAIGLLEFYIRVTSESDVYSDVIQEAQSNNLLHTVRFSVPLDTASAWKQRKRR